VRSQLKGVVNEVPTHGDADAVGIFFLRPMVNDNTSIRNCLIFEDVLNFIVRKEKDGVSGFCGTRFPLGEAVELLAHCWHPEVFEIGVVLEFPILCGSTMFGDEMDNSEADFFDVECGNILRGYLYVVTTVLIHQDGIYGFEFPNRFLEISCSCRDLTSLFKTLFSLLLN
jgi:hypothetical protein